MKTQIIIISIFLSVACSGGVADYSQTITRQLMSKAPAGEGYDVKIMDMAELPSVTVADSIAILQSDFENDRNDKIEHMKGVISLAALLPEGPARQSREKVLQHTIDSLENLTVPDFYNGSLPGKVLAVPVRCRYSLSAPGVPSAVIEIFDFWLSPDGKSVLYQRRSK